MEYHTQVLARSFLCLKSVLQGVEGLPIRNGSGQKITLLAIVSYHTVILWI